LKITGIAWKYGDDVNTDVIIPGKYKFRITDVKELAKHAMEGIDLDFYKKIKQGDIIVAGKNFGCGSSREHAPVVLKEAGIGAIVARSFARIFLRNAINIGLPIVECDELFSKVKNQDIIEIDLEEGIIRNLTSGAKFSTKPMPKFLLTILKDGGLAGYFQKHGDFKLQ
jgi:3-isopropylmalate/(R)-2-methylmalate dehydratase small subunit